MKILPGDYKDYMQGDVGKIGTVTEIFGNCLGVDFPSGGGWYYLDIDLELVDEFSDHPYPVSSWKEELRSHGETRTPLTDEALYGLIEFLSKFDETSKP